MSSQLVKDIFFLKHAALNATMGTCIRKQVGCVLVNGHGHTVGGGRNGVPRGYPHCNQQTGFNFVYANGVNKKKPLTGQSTGTTPVFGNACKGHEEILDENRGNCGAIHAEENALLQCANVFDIESCYVTCSPCFGCAKLLLNTSCRRIVFGEQYSKHYEFSRELWLKDPDREWIHLPDVI